MHHYEATNGASFNYNSDFSGDLLIGLKDGSSVQISAEDILQFVAYCYIQRERIARLEQQDWKEILR